MATNNNKKRPYPFDDPEKLKELAENFKEGGMVDDEEEPGEKITKKVKEDGGKNQLFLFVLERGSDPSAHRISDLYKWVKESDYEHLLTKRQKAYKKSELVFLVKDIISGHYDKSSKK